MHLTGVLPTWNEWGLSNAILQYGRHLLHPPVSLFAWHRPPDGIGVMSGPMTDLRIAADGVEYRFGGREHQRDRTWSGIWLPAPVCPLLAPSRAEAICVTAEGAALVVANDGRWTLPGGSIELGEGVEEALVREVREEACARVEATIHLGCLRIEDLDGADDHRVDVEAVYWARVSLDRFVERFETTARREVPLPELGRILSFWPGSEPLVARMVAEASRVEKSTGKTGRR